MRSGYLSRVRVAKSLWPGRVTTYCFWSSSSRLALRRRIMPAVPAAPTMMTGIQICSSIDFAFSQLIGSERYFWSIKWPIEVPNQNIGEIHEDQGQHEIRDCDADESDQRQAVSRPSCTGAWQHKADRKRDDPVKMMVTKETRTVSHRRSPTTSLTGNSYSKE